MNSIIENYIRFRLAHQNLEAEYEIHKKNYLEKQKKRADAQKKFKERKVAQDPEYYNRIAAKHYAKKKIQKDKELLKLKEKALLEEQRLKINVAVLEREKEVEESEDSPSEIESLSEGSAEGSDSSLSSSLLSKTPSEASSLKTPSEAPSALPSEAPSFFEMRRTKTLKYF